MSIVGEIDGSQRMIRTLAHFLDECTIEERIKLLTELQMRGYRDGYQAGLTWAIEDLKSSMATDAAKGKR
jgi:hypothetical protein